MRTSISIVPRAFHLADATPQGCESGAARPQHPWSLRRSRISRACAEEIELEMSRESRISVRPQIRQDFESIARRRDARILFRVARDLSSL